MKPHPYLAKPNAQYFLSKNNPKTWATFMHSFQTTPPKIKQLPPKVAQSGHPARLLPNKLFKLVRKGEKKVPVPKEKCLKKQLDSRSLASP
jgi:hypothetical protein